jgi:nucleoside phosphorylase
MHLPAKVIILTPIALEYSAMRDMLSSIESFELGSYACVRGKVVQESGSLSVLLVETGSGNQQVGFAALKAMQVCKANAVILTGIAGGVKDAGLGDIVVGTRAYGYESAKETATGTLSRPSVFHYSSVLQLQCKKVAEAGQWKRNSGTADPSKVYFGPIASGEKVVATTESPVYQSIKQYYNDTLALEMEAIGFARALHDFKDVECINIRGISDLLDGKTSAHDKTYQPIAAKNAAAFVFELLKQIDLKPLPHMDPKEIGQALAQRLLPYLSAKDLPTGQLPLSPQAPAVIREVWGSVLPLLQADLEFIEDEDSLKQSLAKEVGKATKKDEGLKAELEALLAKLREADADNKGGVSIQNSKNVVQGSTISVGGDFRLGDG